MQSREDAAGNSIVIASSTLHFDPDSAKLSAETAASWAPPMMHRTHNARLPRATILARGHGWLRPCMSRVAGICCSMCEPVPNRKEPVTSCGLAAALVA